MRTHELDDDAACAGECPLGQAMQRRAFMERTALAALGAMMVGCGDGVFGPDAITATILPGTNFAIRIADYPTLAAVGGIAVTNLGGVPVAIGRTSATTFNIYSLVCPHQSNAVSQSGSGFKCSGHNATWSMSGVWTGGQSTGNLTVYPSVFDPITGLLTLNGGAPPAFEQDFTIDLTTVPALAPVGGYTSVTRAIPNKGATPGSTSCTRRRSATSPTARRAGTRGSTSPTTRRSSTGVAPSTMRSMTWTGRSSRTRMTTRTSRRRPRSS